MTLSNISQISVKYPNLEPCPDFFCLLKKKIWGVCKRATGPSMFHVLEAVLKFLLTWGFSTLGALAFPFQWVLLEENLTKIYQIGAKTKSCLFFKKKIEILEGFKKAGFWQNHHLIEFFGYPPWDYFNFWRKKNCDPPKKFTFADRI